MSERYEDFTLDWRTRVRRARVGCRAGGPDNCVALGDYYWASPVSGMMYQGADWDLARALYDHACWMGHAAGCGAYAQSWDGIGEENRPELTLAFGERACEMGHGRSCQLVGYFHARGFDVPEDEETAWRYNARACALGDRYGCESLSDLYDIERENGTAGDTDLIACLHGKGSACMFLSDDFRSGRGAYPRDSAIAARLREIACEEGEEEPCD